VSNRSEPLDSRSVLCRKVGAGADQVADRRHELQGIERLDQERLGSGGQRLITRVDRGDGEDRHRTVVSCRAAQRQTCATGDQQIDDKHARRLVWQDVSCRGRVEHDANR
jgi:hypothetical protein